MKPFQLTYGLLALATTLSTYTLQAQQGIGNHGAMELHGEGAVGFHTNFLSEGSFENQQGLAGFYTDNGSLRITGSVSPVLYDAEFATQAGIWLEIPMAITNNANLISGDLRTTRTTSNTYPLFSFNSFYTGESDVSKIDGYASVENREVFTFPIGDANRIRPLILESETVNTRASSAYFFENPEASGTLGMSFKSSTDPESQTLSTSKKEFWRLEGSIPSRVTLSWDVLSSVTELGRFLADLRVVGWNKSTGEWEDLGNTSVTGGRDYGSITSDLFVPDNYEIITLGGTNTVDETYRTVELDNYYLSPNGDGINESLEIEATREHPNNSIQIYNRHGLLVFSQDQYTGGFNGKSNVDLTVNRGSGLEPGIYFYIITFHDLRERHQGYFYLND